jgi:hypothetical protein
MPFNTPGVRPMVDATTAHLVFGVDDKMLNAASESEFRANGMPRVVKHGYGWLMFLSGDAEPQKDELHACFEAGCSKTFLDVLHYAHRAGAYVLNFDQDADPLPGVEVH